MKVLAVLLDRRSLQDIVQGWSSELSHDDTLFTMALAGSGTQDHGDYDFHYLDLLPGESFIWRSSVVRGLAYLPRLVRPFWNSFVARIWTDFYRNVRSFDPDVIDVRAVPFGSVLKQKLEERCNITALVNGEAPSMESVDQSWRRYDPQVRVSIVLPVYNGSRYLRQAIESCLLQTHEAIELVLVDDGSTDETPDIVRHYAREDTRVVTLRNEHNLGLPKALNVGFGYSTGELLTWTSHDNYYERTAVEELVRYLCTWPDVDLVYSAYNIMDEAGLELTHRQCPGFPWELPYGNNIGPFFLYRKEILEKIGEYHEEMEYAEDYDYWVRIAKRFTMMPLHLPLYHYRKRRGLMNQASAGRAERAAQEVRRKHFGRNGKMVTFNSRY